MLQLTLGLIAHQSLVTVSFVPRLTGRYGAIRGNCRILLVKESVEIISFSLKISNKFIINQ